jgi:hypothetical protein
MTSVVANAPPAGDAHTLDGWVSAIINNREKGLAARRDNSAAREGSSSWVVESTALVVDLLRAFGAEGGTDPAGLEQALKKKDITLPRGGEPANAIARAVMGSQGDKMRASRVARAAQELIKRGINDVGGYLRVPGQGIVKLADEWTARTAPPLPKSPEPQPWDVVETTLTIRTTRSFQDLVSKSKHLCAFGILGPDGRWQPIGAASGSESTDEFLLVREAPKLADAKRVELKAWVHSTFHHENGDFHVLKLTDDVLAWMLTSGLEARLVGTNPDELARHVPGIPRDLCGAEQSPPVPRSGGETLDCLAEIEGGHPARVRSATTLEEALE